MYVRNCAIAFLPHYLREFQGLFSRVLHHECHLPYTSIGNVVNNGHRPDSTAYTLFKQLPILPEKEIIEIITGRIALVHLLYFWL